MDQSALSGKSYRVCKPAYLVPVPIQDKLGGFCQEGIRRKNGGDGKGGEQISLEGLPRKLLLIAACVVWQNGEQCIGGRDEINSCIDAENANTRTVAAAAGCNIELLDVGVET